MSSSPVSDVAPVDSVTADGVDRGVVASPELDAAVVDLDMSTITSRFSPLNSPVSMVSVDQVIVELPTPYDAPVVPLEISHLATLNPQESQVSRWSSAQLSPNRVREDFDFNTLDVLSVFMVSPRTDGYLPCVYPVSSPSSPVSPAAPTVGSLLDEATGSFDSNIGSPATSLSITDLTANFHLLSEPLIPLPDAILLDTDAARLFDLTKILFHHRGRFPRSPHHQRSCHGRGRLMHQLSRIPPATTR